MEGEWMSDEESKMEKMMNEYNDETAVDIVSGAAQPEMRKMIAKKCETCGKEMMVLSENARYCSKKCTRFFDGLPTSGWKDGTDDRV